MGRFVEAVGMVGTVRPRWGVASTMVSILGTPRSLAGAPMLGFSARSWESCAEQDRAPRWVDRPDRAHLGPDVAAPGRRSPALFPHLLPALCLHPPAPLLLLLLPPGPPLPPFILYLWSVLFCFPLSCLKVRHQFEPVADSL